MSKGYLTIIVLMGAIIIFSVVSYVKKTSNLDVNTTTTNIYQE